MLTEVTLHIEEISTILGKNGQEIICMIVGHLGENRRRSTTLSFRDPACPDNPFWWMGSEDQVKEDPWYGPHVEIIFAGQIRCRADIIVQLDYEDKARAQRLKILDAAGVAFLKSYEGTIPHWLQGR